MTRFEYQQWGARAVASRGQQLPQAKLTPEKVLLIRANKQGKTARNLGVEFGVHHRTIEKVLSRETWSHIK